MSTSLSCITLTTDFGLTDHYVAQMKGVILGLAPHARIVDVTHEISPQNVRRAAFLVADLADAFPIGTVHVAVVDPGVGSERTILAVAAGGRFYVAPDNGLLSLILKRHPTAEIVSVANRRYLRPTVTSTFHGRDVMAPAGAHLLNGVSIQEFGPPLDRPAVTLADLAPEVFATTIDASIAWIDRFGNLITNVDAELLRRFTPERLRVTLGDTSLRRLRRYYAEVPTGEPLLLIGSSGRLEIAVNGGHAAAFYNVSEGCKIVVDQIDDG